MQKRGGRPAVWEKLILRTTKNCEEKHGAARHLQIADRCFYDNPLINRQRT